MKYIKMFELFDANELRAELEEGRKKREILDRFFPDGYKGSEWYGKMKEYEKQIWAIIREAEDPKNMPKALLDSLGQSDPLEVKCHNRKGWGGYMFIEPEARAMIYFDNLDEAKERKILDMAAEIEEYSKLGHDSAWTVSMNSLLGELKRRMSRDGYCDAELWDANKKAYVPYVFKKTA